jgi:hypothetical protein
MAMDEMTRRLRRELDDSLAELSDEQITALIKEARDEALAEAKAIIKETMVRAILERALGQFEGTRNRTALTESKEQIQREIEAIRRKISENERLLSQMRSSDAESEGAEVRAAPGQEIAEDYGYYVYGITGGDNSQPIEGLPEEGIDPAYPVYSLQLSAISHQPSAISHQPSAISHRPSAISAIVSRVSLHEFGQEELEAHLNDIKWVEAKVLAHQRVLDQVLAYHTLVPMRFCTLYRSESGVQEMLAQHYDDFVEALARLEGKQEWGVKVYRDGKTLAQRVGETNDRVKELKAEMEQKSRGAAYFLKKKVDEAIAEEMEWVSDEYAQRSHNRLSSHAEEAVINPLQGKEFTDREEAMILNATYLVAEEQLTAFRAELESLKEEYGDQGFVYEMTGPWPPYNFVSIGLEESAAHE